MLELLVVAALVLLNGFFAMSEMSLMTSRKSRLKQMAQSSTRAAKALALAENPENFLSTVQIGITAIGILTGVFGGEAIGEAIAAKLQSLFPALSATFSLIGQPQPYSAVIGKTLAIVLITFLTLIFGELVPKRLALTRSEVIAGFVAVPMGWLALIAAPAVWVLSRSTRLVLRVLGLGNEQSASVTEEEIRMLVAESHEAGVIDSHERDMMNRVMRLGDRTADSLMTPRNRIAWLDANAEAERNFQVMREHEFSRYPVYRGSDQDIAGVLEVKSLVTRMDGNATQLFQSLRETLFVSESTHAMKLLEIFREEQQSMALVVDEYGEIQGLVTISDLMGAVVGRLQSVDNADEDALVVTRADGSLLIDGSLAIEDLRELLGGAELPNAEEGDYNTLAGLCIYYFGRIPHAGEFFDWAGWRIEIVDLDGARVDKLLLSKLQDENSDDITG
ncbi:HlyC/CorC family transporter [Xanthomonas sp. CFBP 8703]|uniref:HlyC/CorC family transporter n=1 Tax=Xanthomonas bonasiae TaxID=2810351 RepID=A0ABS3AZP9_9XANT|nr:MULTISPECIES: hemolysin family protein [Xanthomonas]MCC4595130.1 hemolysin family protein [Xanthomonas campestris pv. phormiicola]MBD7923933.1 HlyC/CorC family transporter [Xanthomonas surreyensis]MBN6100636.1 HlyC/CorC family transporter [Xanthomonas bonasiae]MBN6110906.1 HlyC/CorC family transporter [Xanthomonas bonasiae]NYF19047.1 putative hemolysin [Xanthomonas sp. JAI131]